ncbi:regulatory protein TetR [Thermodesulfatator indicus DSM 15286]|uniref:Regulatory protein TetR n=1 Tax=Thermodesulfatator indicus (strain DSM 15286 / JCM 11887 / CIR29812) TaxID=667014 RepID=F8A8X6_THEID|nr:CerR family C-terminal domain-containing protein [Thermodesulfatator indicus]AEH44023.1 regulatory protein TetR [Thermodesulfatator indicus DSM 15286]
MKNKFSDKFGTKERLIEVAERLFAEKGFKGVSVREITSQAKVHLGAINYYFGSKEGLYLEVFQTRFLERAKRLKETFEKNLKDDDPNLEGVIRAFAKAIISGPLTEEEREIHFKLLAREMVRPSSILKLIVEEALNPFLVSFEEALKIYLPSLPPEKMRMAVLSILAQILYFNFARPKVQEVTGQKFDAHFEKFLIEHVVSFSLKGIEGLA